MKMKKRAVLTAINDYGTRANKLNGCINDINLLAAPSLDKLGFDISKLIDKDVTKANLFQIWKDTLLKCEYGDWFFVQYSGHGTQIPDISGDEPDGYDEALFLIDGEFSDDTVSELIKIRPEGVNMVIFFDCCYSGTGTRDLDTGVRFHAQGRMAEYIQKKKRKRSIVRDGIDYIYLSGCSENETSADAYIGNNYFGAFSYFAYNTLKSGISYERWHGKYTTSMRRWGFDQHPQMEGCRALFRSGVFGTNRKCLFNN